MISIFRVSRESVFLSGRQYKVARNERSGTHLGGRGGRTCGTAAKLFFLSPPVVGAGTVLVAVLVVLPCAGCPYRKVSRCR